MVPRDRQDSNPGGSFRCLPRAIISIVAANFLPGKAPRRYIGAKRELPTILSHSNLRHNQRFADRYCEPGHPSI